MLQINKAGFSRDSPVAMQKGKRAGEKPLSHKNDAVPIFCAL